ncbi:MAG: hypothetical protein WAV66_04825, partial [Anaerolineae bacterium]
EAGSQHANQALAGYFRQGLFLPSRRMNSGRKGVPPPGRPAPTEIASMQVRLQPCPAVLRITG